jgi:hypothetical protein
VFEMYTSGFLKTLTLRRNNGSNTKPSSPSISHSRPLSPHIADCAREDIERTGSVSIVSETNSVTGHNVSRRNHNCLSIGQPMNSNNAPNSNTNGVLDEKFERRTQNGTRKIKI